MESLTRIEGQLRLETKHQTWHYQMVDLFLLRDTQQPGFKSRRGRCLVESQGVDRQMQLNKGTEDMVMQSSFSHVQLFVTPRTIACQASLSWDSPGKQTEVGGHAFLQGIFPTQGSNPCLLYLLHWQAGPLPLVLPGKLRIWVGINEEVTPPYDRLLSEEDSELWLNGK